MKRFLALLVAVGAAWIAPALAEDWPERTVRIIVPFPAASTPDFLARLLADRLTARLGKPFIVENKPGAGGMIGTDLIAKAKPDGYTIGVSITGPLVNNALLYRKMPYDPVHDLAPITLAVNQPCILVAAADFNAASVPELIAELKRSPGKFNYASLGIGTMAHLAMELVATRSGTQIVQIPYPGSAQAVAALIAGDAQLACLPAAAVMPQVKAGKLKAIGVASARRSSLLPDMPTLLEQGLAGVEANSWIGVVAPAQTPKPILERMHREIVAILHQAEVVESLRVQLMEAVGDSPEAFIAYMKQEFDRWGPVIKANKISLD